VPADVRRWHADLFAPFVPVWYYAGHFRCDDPNKSCLHIDVQVAGVLGTHFRSVPEEVERLFESIEAQIAHLELTWPQITPRQRAIQLAATVANLVGRFVQIHPFINGNGRTSRLLWRWCLLRFGVPVQCCVHPRPPMPYGQLMGFAMKGQFNALALFVLQHLALNPPHK
jgi:fido (protein-threonine AMPylation protein)